MRLAFYLDTGQVVDLEVNAETLEFGDATDTIKFKASWTPNNALPGHRYMRDLPYIDFSRIVAVTLEGDESEWGKFWSDRG